jgi:CheY-like chemotaxis protein
MIRKVLIADDDAINQRRMQTLLEAAGYRVLSLSVPERLLATCRAFQPHLLLINVGLASADDYYLCRQLRQNNDSAELATSKPLPILLCFRENDPIDPGQAHQAGVTRCVAQQNDPKGVLKVVQELLRDPPDPVAKLSENSLITNNGSDNLPSIISKAKPPETVPLRVNEPTDLALSMDLTATNVGTAPALETPLASTGETAIEPTLKTITSDKKKWLGPEQNNYPEFEDVSDTDLEVEEFEEIELEPINNDLSEEENISKNCVDLGGFELRYQTGQLEALVTKGNQSNIVPNNIASESTNSNSVNPSTAINASITDWEQEINTSYFQTYLNSAPAESALAEARCAPCRECGAATLTSDIFCVACGTVIDELSA